MNPADLVPGVELYVPSGADLARSRPYYCRLLQVYDDGTGEGGAGTVLVRAQRIRADGTASRRRPRNGSPTVTVAASLVPAAVRRRG